MEKFDTESVHTDLKVEKPPSLLRLKYPDIELNEAGILVTPTQVHSQPACDWDADPNSFYTIVMNDLDAPSRADPKFREWHHWCVVNIPGKDVSGGEVLTEFVGSAPGDGTGIHRYVFVVFKQTLGKQSFDETRLKNNSIEGRRSHSLSAFVTKYSLGTPVAGNFYLTQWDNYVPTIRKQLGLE